MYAQCTHLSVLIESAEYFVCDLISQIIVEDGETVVVLDNLCLTEIFPQGFKIVNVGIVFIDYSVVVLSPHPDVMGGLRNGEHFLRRSLMPCSWGI